MIQDIFKLSP